MNNYKAAFAICGSFCTIDKAVKQLEILTDNKNDIYPVMSFNASSIDTRFGKADDIIEKIEKICGRKIIKTIADAEPVGPVIKPDIMIIEPCTGNTLAKLAAGITDTPVTLAAKAHLRNEKPLLIAVSTNDALSIAAANIGKLMNNKNVYFVPIRQDDPLKKPRSAISDFTLTVDAIDAALKGKQLQPIIFG